MTTNELVAALNDGHLAAAILGAWMRAGAATMVAAVALGVAVVALIMAAVALRRR